MALYVISPVDNIIVPIQVKLFVVVLMAAKLPQNNAI
jgi:hypothetical protein